MSDIETVTTRIIPHTIRSASGRARIALDSAELYNRWPMALRFEFDPVLKILLIRVDGRFTDEGLREYYRAARKYSTATDASGVITEFSAVTEFAVSGEVIRGLAGEEPAMPNKERPRILVAPQTVAYGLARMFQITGESTRPTLSVVRTMDEAIAALGIQSPHFEPLA